MTGNDRTFSSFACFVVALVFVPLIGRAAAQHFDAGAQVTFAHSGEFDSTDTGIGARLSWRLAEMVAADAEIDVFPESFANRTPFSRRRVEGLFGVIAGPRLGSLRPFAKVQRSCSDVLPSVLPRTHRLRASRTPMNCQRASA